MRSTEHVNGMVVVMVVTVVVMTVTVAVVVVIMMSVYDRMVITGETVLE